MKSAVIATVITLAIIFVALVAIEAGRKRGMDPVGVVANAIFPLPVTPPAAPATQAAPATA